jgi:hypothetical protein
MKKKSPDSPPSISSSDIIESSRTFQELKNLFEVKSVTELERVLNIKKGRLGKVLSTSENNSNRQMISPALHQILLEAIAKRFLSGDDMKSWINKHRWPGSADMTEYLHSLYEEIDFEKKHSCLIEFPKNYIERVEKNVLLDMLTKRQQVRQIWITGTAGCGKSTFVISLLKSKYGRDVLKKKKIQNFYYVNVGYKSYDDCVEKIINDSGLVSRYSHEKTLKEMTSKHQCLFILDNFPVDREIEPQWNEIIGKHGKIVVTCRKKWEKASSRKSQGVEEISLQGFSQEQTRQFLGLADYPQTELKKLFKITDGLPLALRIFQGMQQSQNLSFAKSVENLEYLPLGSLEIIEGSTDVSENIRKLFEHSYEDLDRRHPESAKYLLHMGFFKTNEILVSILDQVAQAGSVTSSKLLSTLNVYNFCVLYGINEERIVSIPSLLQEFIRERLLKIPSYKMWQERYVSVIQNILMKTGSTHLYSDSAKEFSLFSIYHASDAMNVFKVWRDGIMKEDEFKKIYRIYINLIEELFLPATEKFLKDYFYEDEMEYTRWVFLFKIIRQNLQGKNYYADEQVEKASLVFLDSWKELESHPEYSFWKKRRLDDSATQLSLPLGFISPGNWLYLYEQEKATSLLNLAVCKIGLNDIDLAYQMLMSRETNELFSIVRDQVLQSRRYILIGKIYEEKGNEDEAFAYFDRALQIGSLSAQELEVYKTSRNKFNFLHEDVDWQDLSANKHRFILHSQHGIQMARGMSSAKLSSLVSQTMNEIMFSFGKSDELAFIEKFAFDWIETMQRYAKADDKLKEKIQTIIQQEKERYSGHIPKNFEQLILGLDDI